MWLCYSSLPCLLSAALLFYIFFCYVHFKLVGSKYWKNRNVFQLDPVFILGNNCKELFFSNVGFILANRYKAWKDKKLVGFWSLTNPGLLVTDLELIRRILIRDFGHFTDRNINVNEDIDPLAGHLVNLQGTKWRNLRVKLTPTFTSGKMKMMFPTMVDCGLQLQKFLKEPAENQQVLEVREVFAKFTTDIISSCAFGIESNCLVYPDSEFRNYGRKIFEPSYRFLIRFLLSNFCPRIRDFFRIRTIPKDVSDFFLNVVRETMDYRKEKKVQRNDFMELLIQLRNKGSLDDVDESQHENVSAGQRFSLNQAAAQAFVFFAAGFETSSTTLSFAFYELALNPDVQDILQKEIDDFLKKTDDGVITYDLIMEMEYLDWVIQAPVLFSKYFPQTVSWSGEWEYIKSCPQIFQLLAVCSETLRKYPPLPFLGRKCTKEYEIPEMGIKLEEGTRVLISILGIQRDPEYFPDPEKFDPNRFSPREKAKRDRLTSMPFGEGPRNCIGNRFGLLQTKVGLVTVLSQFNVEPSEETPNPLEFNMRSLIMTPIGGVPLKITKRRKV